MTVRTCILCGNDIGTGEGFRLGTGVNREVAKHATCLAVWTWRARAERAEGEAAEWKSLAQELRNHESRIQGAIVDADDSIGSAERALDAIDLIVNGPALKGGGA